MNRFSALTRDPFLLAKTEGRESSTNQEGDFTKHPIYGVLILVSLAS